MVPHKTHLQTIGDGLNIHVADDPGPLPGSSRGKTDRVEKNEPDTLVSNNRLGCVFDENEELPFTD